MADDRLIHDAAWAMADSIIEWMEGVFSEENKHIAHAEIYRRCKAGVEAFSVQEARMRQRLGPSRN